MSTITISPKTSSPSLLPLTEEKTEEKRNEQAGVASIKAEFIIARTQEFLSSCNSDGGNRESEEQTVVSEPPPKKKRRQGQNKHRPRTVKIEYSEMLCPSMHDVRSRDTGYTSCPFGDKCRYMHDTAEYMMKKPADIGDTCFMYDQYGVCPYGPACRYAKSHVTKDFLNVIKGGVDDHRCAKIVVCNTLTKQLQIDLRKRQIQFERSKAYLERLGKGTGSSCVGGEGDMVNNGLEVAGITADGAEVIGGGGSGVEREEGDVGIEVGGARVVVAVDGGSGDGGAPCGSITDEGSIRLRPSEKRKIDFRGKLYLAPLTTTGNLPFRRICKEFGADITCGEMAMCSNLLQGHRNEWALLKRHHSEDMFGVQLCGSHVDQMTRCAELINTHTKVDFVDINVGCPIDLVFKKGAGSALLGRTTRLEGIVKGMSAVLDCPLTVKMRAGIHKKNWNAHKLIPKLRDCHISMATVHGRSMEQRYTKLADWDYIRMCVEAASPMPVFGNGDVLSFEDYNSFCENSQAAGLMIARGAIIKPWLFTEIKEQRHWDINSSERLEVIRRYANYGLEHWGSDTQGVENTRRFLLEWLSFLYRYIPVGLLEHVPQRINQRPPRFRGRDDLETLMASSNCQDWVKISEMVLGPAPKGFSFLPKHRANSYL